MERVSTSVSYDYCSEFDFVLRQKLEGILKTGDRQCGSEKAGRQPLGCWPAGPGE